MMASLPQETPIRASEEPLVDIRHYSFILEPVYFNEGLTTDSRMFLRESIAEKLSAVQEGFKGHYRFKIWDAWRSRTVQKKLYERFWSSLVITHPDWSYEQVKIEVETYVANAEDENCIPNHVTGGTIDLTLVNEQGIELDMGTRFDHFGPEAAPFYFETHPSNRVAAQNRKILREAMFSSGFSVFPSEWWHFDYGNQRWAFERGEAFAFFGETSPAS